MRPPAAALVTGASGFVGHHLSAALAGDGRPVRGLVRPGSAPLPSGVESASVQGLLDREGLRRALDGVDTVVHLAARVHVMEERAADPLAEFRRVNVEGTRLLLEEAEAAGVKSFVFASSVKAMGEGGEEVWTERTPARPVDPYGVSKLEAEALVAAAAAALHAVSLRLPLVYGPGVKGNMLRLFHLVDRGLPIPLGAVRNCRSMAYVGNVVAAVRAVLAAPAARGETFLVSDGADLSTPELIRAIAAALGRPARLVPVPAGVFRAAGRLGDLVLGRGRPRFAPAVDRLLGSLAVDPSKLRAVCGFHPPFTPAGGLLETARWYRGAAGRGGGAA